jgi:hypothetical protein
VSLRASATAASSLGRAARKLLALSCRPMFLDRVLGMPCRLLVDQDVLIRASSITAFWMRMPRAQTAA